MKKNLAIAFRSSSLKETFVERLFSSYNYWLSGFRTFEERAAGSRLGFILETARGARFELASKNLSGPARINKYGVNLSGLEAAFKEAFDEAVREKKILLLDELGPMALLSPSVRSLAARALVSAVPCLVFFRRGAKSFEGTLAGLDNTVVAELDPSRPFGPGTEDLEAGHKAKTRVGEPKEREPYGLRQKVENWIEEHIRVLKERE